MPPHTTAQPATRLPRTTRLDDWSHQAFTRQPPVHQAATSSPGSPPSAHLEDLLLHFLGTQVLLLDELQLALPLALLQQGKQVGVSSWPSWLKWDRLQVCSAPAAARAPAGRASKWASAGG